MALLGIGQVARIAPDHEGARRLVPAADGLPPDVQLVAIEHRPAAPRVEITLALPGPGRVTVLVAPLGHGPPPCATTARHAIGYRTRSGQGQHTPPALAAALEALAALQFERRPSGAPGRTVELRSPGRDTPLRVTGVSEQDLGAAVEAQLASDADVGAPRGPGAALFVIGPLAGEGPSPHPSCTQVQAYTRHSLWRCGAPP